MISIIVPVYNASRWLETCVSSVRQQTFSDWELLLIDDGSSDGSEKLCDTVAGIDTRIRTIHQRNGGAANARNHGLDLATGDFLLFLDADDAIPTNHLEVLYRCLIDHQADVAFANVKYEPGPEISHTPAVLTMQETLEKLMYRDGMGDYPVSKLFRRKVWENIRFQEGITSEDFDIFYRLYHNVERVAVTDQTTYYYRQNAESVSNGGFSTKFFNRITICEKLLQDVEREHPQLLPAAHSRMVDEAIWLYGILPKGYEQELKWIRTCVYRYGWNVLLDFKATAKVKRKVIIFLLCPWLWKVRAKAKSVLLCALSTTHINK
jgi:glycosyltransferase involved in cell wall biosynthesis